MAARRGSARAKSIRDRPTGMRRYVQRRGSGFAKRQTHTTARVARTRPLRRRQSTALINHTAMRRRGGERERVRPAVATAARGRHVTAEGTAAAEEGISAGDSKDSSTRQVRRAAGRRLGRRIRHGARYSLGAALPIAGPSLLSREGGSYRVSQRPLRSRFFFRACTNAAIPLSRPLRPFPAGRRRRLLQTGKLWQYSTTEASRSV